MAKVKLKNGKYALLPIRNYKHKKAVFYRNQWWQVIFDPKFGRWILGKRLSSVNRTV